MSTSSYPENNCPGPKVLVNGLSANYLEFPVIKSSLSGSSRISWQELNSFPRHKDYSNVICKKSNGKQLFIGNIKDFSVEYVPEGRVLTYFADGYYRHLRRKIVYGEYKKVPAFNIISELINLSGAVPFVGTPTYLTGEITNPDPDFPGEMIQEELVKIDAKFDGNYIEEVLKIICDQLKLNFRVKTSNGQLFIYSERTTNTSINAPFGINPKLNNCAPEVMTFRDLRMEYQAPEVSKQYLIGKRGSMDLPGQEAKLTVHDYDVPENAEQRYYEILPDTDRVRAEVIEAAVIAGPGYIEVCLLLRISGGGYDERRDSFDGLVYGETRPGKTTAATNALIDMDVDDDGVIYFAELNGAFFQVDSSTGEFYLWAGWGTVTFGGAFDTFIPASGDLEDLYINGARNVKCIGSDQYLLDDGYSTVYKITGTTFTHWATDPFGANGDLEGVNGLAQLAARVPRLVSFAFDGADCYLLSNFTSASGCAIYKISGGIINLFIKSNTTTPTFGTFAWRHIEFFEGTLYVVSSSTNNIYTVSGTTLIPIFGDASKPYGEGYLAADTKIYQPQIIAFDTDTGDMYFTEQGAAFYGSPGGRIRKLTASTGRVNTVMYNSQGEFDLDHTGNPAETALLNQPYGLAVKGSNAANLYFTEFSDAVVCKVVQNGIGEISEVQMDCPTRYGPVYQIDTIGGNGAQGNTGNGGQAIDATIRANVFTADPIDGTIYFFDQTSYYVRKIDPSGAIDNYAGNGVFGVTGTGGLALSASVYPSRLSVDLNGNLWLEEKVVTFGPLVFTQYIRKIDKTTNLIEEFYNQTSSTDFDILIQEFNNQTGVIYIINSSGLLRFFDMDTAIPTTIPNTSTGSINCNLFVTNNRIYFIANGTNGDGVWYVDLSDLSFHSVTTPDDPFIYWVEDNVPVNETIIEDYNQIIVTPLGDFIVSDGFRIRWIQN
jgi:hypothetical protein